VLKISITPEVETWLIITVYRMYIHNMALIAIEKRNRVSLFLKILKV